MLAYSSMVLSTIVTALLVALSSFSIVAAAFVTNLHWASGEGKESVALLRE